jgi:hypothetical protein
LTYPRRGEPLFNFRLPRLTTLALEAEARRVGVSPSAYVRALVIVNLTQRGENGGVRRSVLHTNFDRAVKRFTHQPTHTQIAKTNDTLDEEASSRERIG